jgi:trehalose-phosphatase
VRSLLGVTAPIFFSGVHGLEFCDREGRAEFTTPAHTCAPELARVRKWLAEHTPAAGGFLIEDKEAALGLHYRNADEDQARALCSRFEEFVVLHTPSLKLLHLKKLLEAVPKVAGKDLAVQSFRERFPTRFATAYFGDDTTDEDAFAALAEGDIGVLVGPERSSRADYRVSSPHAVAQELRSLASLADVGSSATSG